MTKQLVFVCITNKFTWGKGKTQIEAMRNARTYFEDEYSMTVILTEHPEEVKVSGMGGIYSSDGDEVFNITPEKPEKLWQVFNDDNFEEFMNRTIDYAKGGIRDKSKTYTDAHYKMYERLDKYIDENIEG